MVLDVDNFQSQKYYYLILPVLSEIDIALAEGGCREAF